jgi:hypothetical protein
MYSNHCTLKQGQKYPIHTPVTLFFLPFTIIRLDLKKIRSVLEAKSLADKKIGTIAALGNAPKQKKLFLEIAICYLK